MISKLSQIRTLLFHFLQGPEERCGSGTFRQRRCLWYKKIKCSDIKNSTFFISINDFLWYQKFNTMATKFHIINKYFLGPKKSLICFLKCVVCFYTLYMHLRVWNIISDKITKVASQGAIIKSNIILCKSYFLIKENTNDLIFWYKDFDLLLSINQF